MKMIRENIFETNSSSTHSLTWLKRGYKLPPRSHKKNFMGKELPIIYDYPNFRVEVRNFQAGEGRGDLTIPEYNASYLFTWLQIKKFNVKWYGNDEEKKVHEALAQFHLMLLENDLIPDYQLISVKYHVFDYNIDLAYPDEPRVTPDWGLEDGYMEMNDGGFIESLDDIWKIIDTKEHLKDFLTKGKIKIKYCG